MKKLILLTVLLIIASVYLPYFLSRIETQVVQPRSEVMRETVWGGAYVKEFKDETCYIYKDNGVISCFPNSKPK